MGNKNRKILAGSMAAVLLLGAGSLAWFTDRTEGTVTGQAGNLCIELSDIEANLDHLAPGDKEDIKFEYRNLGSLAMDTRITYALSYELNEDVEDVINNDLDKVATLKVGDEELILTADNDKVTGTFETGVLNGTKEFPGEDSLSEALNFHFDESVGNIGQLMTFKLDVLVEGKQNRNNPTWEQVHKTEITFGGEKMQVVPKSACNVTDDINAPKYSIVVDDDLADSLYNYYDGHDKFTVIMKRTHDLPDEETGDEDPQVGETGVLNEAKITVSNIKEFDITDIINEWLEENPGHYEGDTISIRIVEENGYQDYENGYAYINGSVRMREFVNAHKEDKSHSELISSDSGRIVEHEAEDEES